ncbi:MAG: septum formation protein Maf [Clostridia bacterium]|nr:septum formation protein Maf [Clostridia bacterium]
MSLNPKRLILASASPRRNSLLSGMGYTFTIHAPDVDETVSGKPEEMVKALAVRKAKAVSETEKGAWIIAADTLVSYRDEALGKPVDEDDAKRMLMMLSGNTHEVFTGVCLLDSDSGKYIVSAVCTRVHFREILPSEADEYIATGEPMDKAGAYAIQGGAAGFVKSFDGSYTNIVGFPTEEFEQMYKRFTGA